MYRQFLAPGGVEDGRERTYELFEWLSVVLGRQGWWKRGEGSTIFCVISFQGLEIDDHVILRFLGTFSFIISTMVVLNLQFFFILQSLLLV